MSDTELLKSRITQLATSSSEGKCVLYVMSRDQRIQDNHALVAAQKHALAKNLPLAVVFCLYDKSGYRRREHYEFMIKGLREVEQGLDKLNIPFMMLVGTPYDRLSATISHVQPDAVYFDMNPLRGPRKLQQRVAHSAECRVYVVDTHNVIPVTVASDKQEFGAYTLRPKLHRLVADYLRVPEQPIRHPLVWPGVVKPIAELDELIQPVIQSIPMNHTTLDWKSGEVAARSHLQLFIETKLEGYAVDRNDPSFGSQSDISPYLHFGQISSLRVALALQEEAHKLDSDLHFLSSPKMPKPEDAQVSKLYGIDSLIEEMIVRKELADNFCYYNDSYDNLTSAHDWAKKTITEHDDDLREYTYTYEQLRDAETHDAAWNAAQMQMRKTGKMHGYMRMYWAKKIKEWTPQASTAIEWSIKLNDVYSIDGGDPNGYAGIMWSVAGVHDRAWNEREVFGKIRYMNYGGLKRKFDIATYEKTWL